MSGDRALQSGSALIQQPAGDTDVVAQAPEPVPDVCFIPDVCKALRVSRRTVERLLRFDAFPIEEIGKLDHRHRWSGAKVRAFRESGQSLHGRQSRPRLLRSHR